VLSNGDSGEELRLSPLEGDLQAGAKAVYRHPDDETGAYKYGVEVLHDGTINGRDFAGIVLDIEVPTGRTFSGTVTTRAPEDIPARLWKENTAAFTITGGDNRVFIRWTDFDRADALDAWVKYIKELSVTGTFEADREGSVTIESARLARGEVVSLSCERRGKATQPGEEAVYTVGVTNHQSEAVAVSAQLERGGWEEMSASVEPETLTIPPGEASDLDVRVTVTDNVPVGGVEMQKLRVIPEGDGSSAETLEFYTSHEHPGPNLIHEPEGWDAVRRKAENYDWAGEKRDQRVEAAREWTVPESQFDGGNPIEQDAYVFGSRQYGKARRCAEAWQLTRDRALAEKVATFLRRFCDPETGYPATQYALGNAAVHEGGAFRALAVAYDLIKDADVLTPADHDRIAKTVRVYESVMHNVLRRGKMGNFSTSIATAGALAALAIDDMAMVQRYLYGPGKARDLIAAGFMSDGWWYVSSLGYTLGVTNQFMKVARALEPRGIDWLNKGFKLNFSDDVSVYPDAKKDLKEFAGISYRKWGPRDNQTITFREIYQGLMPFADYRGVSFGVNDNGAKNIGHRNLELAYFAYRSPDFLPTLHQLEPEDRHLLYGVPELPPAKDVAGPLPYEQSFHADNVGYAVLRSQNDRPEEDRIQAALKWGTHGGHHGHYDRGNLVNLSRHGKNIGLPKVPWFSYVPVFYKCVAQASVTHNMVTVDQKFQFPTESEQLLFHSGDRFQASAMETDTPWSFMPPENQDSVRQYDDLDAMWRYVPEFPDAPENTQKLTGFTEDVRQRRLVIVTDDYAVVADDMAGDNEHTYDHALWIRGFDDMDAERVEFDRRDPQLEDDPRKSAQFITNVDWYDVEGALTAEFSYQVDAPTRVSIPPIRKANNEPGPMNFTVHHAWPSESRQVALCDLPQSYIQKKLWWKVLDDTDEALAEGYTQPWAIGKGEADVDIAGMDTVTLSGKVHWSNEIRTLFWAGRVVTADGETIPLADIPYTAENMLEEEPRTTDYGARRGWEAGPIELAGEPVDKAIPAEPTNNETTGRIELDLSDVDADRLEATIASDHPVGKRPNGRKGLILRDTGQEARFLTVIEPFESESVVDTVEASDSSTVTVQLTDGRRHVFEVEGLDSESGSVTVTKTEYVDGEAVGTETTTQ
jgi:hypothetical protein